MGHNIKETFHLDRASAEAAQAVKGIPEQTHDESVCPTVGAD